jgi:hypothetical protein
MSEKYPHIKLMLGKSQTCEMSLFKAMVNPDPYYDVLREDIDTCCEIAYRYHLIVDEKEGLLLGGRTISVARNDSKA